MTSFRRFIVEIEVDDDKAPGPAEWDMPGENMMAMADELLNALCNMGDDDLPEWVYSFPGVDPDKVSFRG